MSHLSVTVFCGSSPGLGPEYAAAARRLGEGLAQRGMDLVFGGGNVGLMGIVAGAALGAGGHVTGIIPDFLRAREAEFPGLSRLIVTDSMHTRKRRMFALANAFVVLPGGLGTLDELVEIVTWKQLGRHRKPIIICDVLGWAAPVIALIEHVIAEGFATGSARGLIEVADGVAATLALLDAAQPDQGVVPDGVSQDVVPAPSGQDAVPALSGQDAVPLKASSSASGAPSVVSTL